MGSEWIGDRMQDAGLVSPDRRGPSVTTTPKALQAMRLAESHRASRGIRSEPPLSPDDELWQVWTKVSELVTQTGLPISFAYARQVLAEEARKSGKT